ncbi:hypothetical protein SAMN03080594_101542 [Arenibacter palladensis]|uniref:Uncharacterized protein n=1 Tax=Arenibacter palladensis TaxID=237373 RepID=A0A1M4U9R7_9FLAO|nr:hypothetical protein [Arenibacter palladensis]SHE53398.1 hypothetical protein SAMN03080594_101542 [Arenibacter palladensis]
MYKECFQSGLTVRQYAGISLNYDSDIISLLAQKFSRNFKAKTKLRIDEYNYLCEKIFGNETKFIDDCYGKFLNWEAVKLEIAKKNHEIRLKQLHRKCLLEDIDSETKIFSPKYLDITKLLPFFETKFVASFRSKPGEEQMAYVAYITEFGDNKFKKVLMDDYSLTGVYDEYSKYKENEAEYIKDIPRIKIELIQGLLLCKELNKNIKCFEELYKKAYNVKKLKLNYDIIKEQARTIIDNVLLPDFDITFSYYFMARESISTDYNVRKGSKFGITSHDVSQYGLNKINEL